MSIISIIGLLILIFFFYAAILIIKDTIEDCVAKRKENKIWEQYWRKVDYYRKLITCPFCEGLTPVKINNKFGYINESYEVVIQPQFDKANSFYEGFAVVSKGNKEAVLDKTGKIVFIAFGKIEYSEGVAVVNNGIKYGYIDNNFEYIISPQFDYAEGFHEGLAAIKLGEKWGFIDKKGKLIIAVKYDQVYYFHEGLAAVRLGEKWGFINKMGHTVVGFNYDEICRFENGYAKCYNIISKSTNKWQVSVIDKTGKCRFSGDEVWIYEEGFAIIKSNNKWGIISLSGEYIIKPSFDYMWFWEGVGYVKLDNSWWIINKEGKIIINKQFEAIGRFSNGFAAARIDGEWGFIDKSGDFVINPQYNKVVRDFDYDGLAIVLKDNIPIVINQEGATVIKITEFSGYNKLYKDYKIRLQSFSEGLIGWGFYSEQGRISKYGFINKIGEVIVKPQYFETGAFSEGLAPVCSHKGCSYGFIDVSNRYIIKPQFEYAKSFSEGLAVVKKSSSSGYSYINKDGEEVIKTQFYSADDFSNGRALVSIKTKGGIIKSGYINKYGYSAFTF